MVRLGGGALEWTLRGGRGPALQPLCQRKQKRLLFARSAVWHMEIQERQLEDARESARAEALAARKCLRERGASGKAERNRLLRVR